MPLAASKQLQTCLNAFAQAMDQVTAANVRIQQIKAAAVAHSLGALMPTGAATVLSTLAVDLDALTKRAVVAQLKALYSPTHEGKALPGEVD